VRSGALGAMTRINDGIASLVAVLKRRVRTSGVTIGVCGIDGSGKSTQVALLCQALRRSGVPAVRLIHRMHAFAAIDYLAESFTGDPFRYHPLIPATLRGFVLACDAVAEHSCRIARLVEMGRVVVLDRTAFCFSVYSEAYGADMTWISRVLELMPEPDVTALIDVPVDVAHERLLRRRNKPIQSDEERPLLEMYRRVYLARARLARASLVDGSGTRRAVLDRLGSSLAAALDARFRVQAPGRPQPVFPSERAVPQPPVVQIGRYQRTYNAVHAEHLPIGR